MRKWISFAGAAALLWTLGPLLSGCRKAPERPTLTLHFKAQTLEGEPLPGVAVEALGKAQGATDAEGELSFTFTGDVGEEFVASARLDSAGRQFKPWQQPVVVRKWDAARPETLEYRLEARLEPLALSSLVQLDAGGAPPVGAEVRVDGKPVTLDAEGRARVDLGTKLARPATVSVKLKEFQPFSEATTLRAGETFVARLVKIGVQYGKVLVAYEAMGRAMPVADAEVSLGGRPAGRTDKAGTLRYEVPAKPATLEVRAEGHLPSPATGSVPGRKPAQVTIVLVPREPPSYRLALLAPKNASPGDAEVEASLAEIEDKLTDHLFSHACFARAESEKGADAVVSSTVSRTEGGVLLSVRVAWANGAPIGGFAQVGKSQRIKSLVEAVAEKVVEVFPFEGHVLSFEGERVVTSLGSGKDRGVKKGDAVAFYHWDGKTPPKPASLGRAVVRGVDSEFSRVEPQRGATTPAIGDKVVLLPRAVEAAFDSAITLTVKAGRPGSERAFSDVSVYRDGLWVGTTNAKGEIRVPRSSREKHEFLFAKGGVKPYREEIAAEAGGEKTILLPDVASRFRLESEPSGARVRLDDEELGTTPLETDVVMGFHRLVVDAGGEWRAFDKVVEFAGTETDLIGPRRVKLQQDLLKRAQSRLDGGDVDGAIEALSQVTPGHPDYSAAHHRLAGLYLDQKKDANRAIAEFQKVLELPENRELVNKRFAVTFLNLGRAYYMLGTPEGYRKAIDQLVVARDNKRFFPRDQHDQATHDTHYFLALASHKLHHSTGGERLLQETSTRWKDYFDYFPEGLAAAPSVKQARTSAEQYYEEIKRALKETE